MIGLDIRTFTQRGFQAEWAIIFVGLTTLCIPTFIDLANTLWVSDDQAHGPIIFATAGFLFWQKRAAILAPSCTEGFWPGGVILITGLSIYVIGRTQQILIFEVGSIIWVLAIVIFLMKGIGAVKALWFPLFFMLFMIPLPGTLVDALTMPMKMAVSYVVEHALFKMNYPIARSGVILQIGQYKLMVADACAGLHTLFSLEALGLLYLNLVRYSGYIRNVTLAILIIPISFTANVIRVLTLSLITYHFGDDAGQGFVHGFAGAVLFFAALFLIIFADSFLRISTRSRPVSNQ